MHQNFLNAEPVNDILSLKKALERPDMFSPQEGCSTHRLDINGAEKGISTKSYSFNLITTLQLKGFDLSIEVTIECKETDNSPDPSFLILFPNDETLNGLTATAVLSLNYAQIDFLREMLIEAQITKQVPKLFVKITPSTFDNHKHTYFITEFHFISSTKFSSTKLEAA